MTDVAVNSLLLLSFFGLLTLTVAADLHGTCYQQYFPPRNGFPNSRCRLPMGGNPSVRGIFIRNVFTCCRRRTAQGWGSASHCRSCASIRGILSSWSDWSVCSTTCGWGYQRRHRYCSTAVCAGVVGRQQVEKRSCMWKTCCPVDGNWSDWSGWSRCSASCDDGLQYRTRSCSSPAPSCGGRRCRSYPRQMQRCRNAECAHWSAWTTQPCSVTCGTGVIRRTRECHSVLGDKCYGDYSSHTPCHRGVCEVSGDWCAWGSWSSCTSTCAEKLGTKKRGRICNCPAPGDGGRDCKGSDGEVEYCHSKAPCRVHGGWSAWSEWSDCSAAKCSQIQGFQERKRLCNNPTPAHGGAPCHGVAEQVRACLSLGGCEVDGVFGKWSPWSPCSASCGLCGRKTRYRSCFTFIGQKANIKIIGQPKIICERQKTIALHVCNTHRCPDGTLPCGPTEPPSTTAEISTATSPVVVIPIRTVTSEETTETTGTVGTMQVTPTESYSAFPASSTASHSMYSTSGSPLNDSLPLSQISTREPLVETTNAELVSSTLQSDTESTRQVTQVEAFLDEGINDKEKNADTFKLPEVEQGVNTDMEDSSKEGKHLAQLSEEGEIETEEEEEAWDADSSFSTFGVLSINSEFDEEGTSDESSNYETGSGTREYEMKESTEEDHRDDDVHPTLDLSDSLDGGLLDAAIDSPYSADDQLSLELEILRMLDAEEELSKGEGQSGRERLRPIEADYPEEDDEEYYDDDEEYDDQEDFRPFSFDNPDTLNGGVTPNADDDDYLERMGLIEPSVDTTSSTTFEPEYEGSWEAGDVEIEDVPKADQPIRGCEDLKRVGGEDAEKASGCCEVLMYGFDNSSSAVNATRLEECMYLHFKYAIAFSSGMLDEEDLLLNARGTGRRCQYVHSDRLLHTICCLRKHCSQWGRVIFRNQCHTCRNKNHCQSCHEIILNG